MQYNVTKMIGIIAVTFGTLFFSMGIIGEGSNFLIGGFIWIVGVVLIYKS